MPAAALSAALRALPGAGLPHDRLSRIAAQQARAAAPRDLPFIPGPVSGDPDGPSRAGSKALEALRRLDALFGAEARAQTHA